MRSIIEQRVAIVTGASRGIGRAIAERLASDGRLVVLTSRSADALEEVHQAISQAGGQSEVCVCDVADGDALGSTVEGIASKHGRLDILVNNSGVFDGGPIEELSLETWQKVIDVNLTAPFLCTREAMKIMKPQGGGRIINIGSISAQMPRMNSAPYTSTKHALVGLTKCTALEGREFGVVASCLHPGNVTTERTVANNAVGMEGEPRMNPEDIAMAALTMAALPPNVNMLESIVLPVTQKYVGRG